MTPAAVGRADLVRALAAAGPGEAGRIAGMLGYRLSDDAPALLPRPPAVDGGAGQALAPSEPAEIRAAPTLPIPFWRATTYARRGAESLPPTPAVQRPRLPGPPTGPPLFHVLAPMRDLSLRLRPAVTARRAVGGIDCDRVVERVSRGTPIHPAPRETARRLAPALHVILDRSNRLIPYWDDQDLVSAVLKDAFPADRLAFSVFHEALEEPTPLDDGPGGRSFTPPPAGGVVLVLGDLGALARDGGEASSLWRELGRRIRASGGLPAALTPCRPGRVARGLADLWRLIAWERPDAGGGGAPASPREAADQLLVLASPAIRIEPGLLRALRRAAPAGLADAGAEGDAWLHPALESQSPHGATLRREAAEALRIRFAALPADLQARALRIQKSWRHGLPDDIWYEEVINLPWACHGNLPDPDDLAAARQFFSFVHGQPGGITGRPADVINWLDRVGARATADALSREPEFARAVESARLRQGVAAPRGDYDPGLVAAGPDVPPEGLAYDILQVPGGLIARPSDPLGSPGPGSLIGVVRSANGLIRLDTDDPFWASGRAPAWASEWGRDDFGAWVTFRVGEATQRMRWIPPGAFLMGSPEGEPGQWGDEGPQVGVTFADGFWMFDTPCTQALWTAVMGDNPSRFRGLDRPVEQVSFEDVSRFLGRLNARLPGLCLDLPSEARWEYACRAGTTTATYAGRLSGADLGSEPSPILDEIAWYKANVSGISAPGPLIPSAILSLPDDKSGDGTRPGALKAPNGWGLFDMLGKVDEWCLDAWNGRHTGAATNGAARKAPAGESEDKRVVRGGSWINVARNLRAAYRNANESSLRRDGLGFRCARVQGDGLAEASPADRAGRPGAESSRTPAPTGDAGPWLRAGGPPVPLRSGTRARITTDRDILTLERDLRPKWATAMGRDAFGLHADFTVPGTEVTQRMRWIPPGRFAMGSPEDEPGRFPDDGPVHEVTLASGYWLFDTPCTQALWAAVMRQVPDDREEARRLIAKNPRWADRNAMIEPSYFKTPERPVESVSHEDLWTFIDRLNLLVPDLNLTLPSEAEWEYACRAGTATATYAGPIDILGERNAPTLDSIAWYGGNSGVGFELENGIDSSKWKEKQYPHSRTGANHVKKRIPNHLGLFDMLGNVYEWCADTWHTDCVGAPMDGSAWIEPALEGKGEAWRVVRGGSWSSYSRVVRAAYRRRFDPADRSYNLGFRCARVQSASERERRALRIEPAATNGPERAGLVSLFQSRKRAPKAPRRKK